uniref:Uncharacterized protein n=1 Tax=Oryza meridionalis TaxID=40149 RepID=A0A0E0EQF9_9ORYZ
MTRGWLSIEPSTGVRLPQHHTEHVMNAVAKFAVVCRKAGIMQLGVIWSKHICLYSAGIFLLCSSENPLFFLPVNASAVVDSEFRLTKFSFFEQQQISEFLLPRLVLRVVLVLYPISLPQRSSNQLFW